MLVCINGGFGNQIGNYIFAQYLIEKGIDCKIIASNKAGDAREFVLNKFDIELELAKIEDIKEFLNAKSSPALLFNLLTKNIFDKNWRNNLWNFLKRIRAEYGVYPVKTPVLLSKIITCKDFFKYGCKQGVVCDCYAPINEFYDENFKNKMMGKFSLKTLKTPLDTENKRILEKIKTSKNPVGVHIRRGDFISYGFPVVKSEFILEKMKYLSQNLDGVCFFIFSDDINWAKENIKGFKNVEFVDKNDESKGYLDFLLFNECIHRIYSGSTFSLWIRYFNPYKSPENTGIKESLEFYPKKADMQIETPQNKYVEKADSTTESGDTCC